MYNQPPSSAHVIQVNQSCPCWVKFASCVASKFSIIGWVGSGRGSIFSFMMAFVGLSQSDGGVCWAGSKKNRPTDNSEVNARYSPAHIT